MPDPIQAEPTVPAGDYPCVSSSFIQDLLDNPQIKKHLAEQQGKVVDVEALTRLCREVYGEKNG